ncbi:hypothetical protein AA14337_3091 [Acetobacter malorum DSM 14337]|uniref:Uncharacterized protein n=1 Tax=Acetobacter malorum DSM 14337 TaxID=1307910 RepID=A0ABQ0PZL5_9PROT|nr:hypothetical protein [Acetobacter malorum]KXV05677.1 hypothetical protein AD930_11115 [Acetobacter malorum]GBQ85514.1 hypothetical protein AA14337_3091 [Acetobacter malorum DSM 14337]
MMGNCRRNVIQYSAAGLALIISGVYSFPFVAYCTSPNLTPETAARSALAERFLKIRDEGPASDGKENYGYVVAGTEGVFTVGRDSAESIRDVLSRRLIVLEEQKQEEGAERLVMKVGNSLHCRVLIPQTHSEFWLVSFDPCSDENASDKGDGAVPKGGQK